MISASKVKKGGFVVAKLVRITPKIGDNWADIKDDFILLKKAQGMADRTIEDYEYHISKFFNEHPDIVNYDMLERNVLTYFAESSKLAIGTYNIRRKNLNTFFNWCVGHGLIPANPIRHIRKKKDDGRIRPISEDDLKRLLGLPEKKTYCGLRDYTLMLLSLDTGIRPSEAISLKDSDVNIESGEVFVRQEVAKARISRTLPISDEVIPHIVRIIGINKRIWNQDYIFCSSTGLPMKISLWKQRMALYSRKLGRQVSAYDLRHAFAIMYLRNGGDAFMLQRIMGHADMEMTKRYLKFSQTDLQNAHANASPLASLLGRKKKIIKLK